MPHLKAEGVPEISFHPLVDGSFYPMKTEALLLIYLQLKIISAIAITPLQIIQRR